MSHTPLKKNPVTPISNPHKELEPPPRSSVESLPQEDRGEKKLSPEVKEYIENRDEQQKLKKTEALKQVGAQTPEDTDELQEKIGPLLALSDAKIEEGLQKPVSSSFRWLAEFMRYLLRQAGYSLKKVHGHLKRIATPNT